MTSFHRGAVRPLIALSLVALLAACGQSNQEGVTTHSQYSRPASYDPPGPPEDPWGPWIREASRRFDVPERWIREVMRQESGGRASATSRAGAMGLMQVMPGTYRELQARYGLGNDPYHPYDSIMAGTAYIREMYDLYGSPAFLAAYNAGPRRLEDYLWNSRGLPAETRNYVARIGPRIIDTHPTRRAPAEVYAAAEIPLSIPSGPRRMDRATMLALREQRERANPGIQVAQLPPGPVVRMEPIPDGSTTQAAASNFQVASLGGVVRMEPIPDGSTYEGAARLAESASRQEVATVPAPVERRNLPAPPRSAAPVASASALYAASAPRPPSRPERSVPARAEPARIAVAQAEPLRTPPSRAPRGLGLIGTAHASTLPAAARTATPGGGWAVQVGAFASENLARAAANRAHDAVATLGARPLVQPVRQGRTTLYRARVTGLSRDRAESACASLRARGDCMIVSPDAQG